MQGSAQHDGDPPAPDPHDGRRADRADCRRAPARRSGHALCRGLSPLGGESQLASQPTFSRAFASFTTGTNLAALQDSIFDSAACAVHAMHGDNKLGPVTLDIDSFLQEVFGALPGSEWNGHYKERCYQPLGVTLGETGHWLGLELRPGNVHTADGDADMLLPLIDRVETKIASIVGVRGDAGFVSLRLLAALEARGVRGVRYAFRLPTNSRSRKSSSRTSAAHPVGDRKSRVPGPVSCATGRDLAGEAPGGARRLCRAQRINASDHSV